MNIVNGSLGLVDIFFRIDRSLIHVYLYLITWKPFVVNFIVCAKNSFNSEIFPNEMKIYFFRYHDIDIFIYVSWLWLSLLRGWGSLTIRFTGKFVYIKICI